MDILQIYQQTTETHANFLFNVNEAHSIIQENKITTLSQEPTIANLYKQQIILAVNNNANIMKAAKIIQTIQLDMQNNAVNFFICPYTSKMIYTFQDDSILTKINNHWN